MVVTWNLQPNDTIVKSWKWLSKLFGSLLITFIRYLVVFLFIIYLMWNLKKKFITDLGLLTFAYGAISLSSSRIWLWN